MITEDEVPSVTGPKAATVAGIMVSPPNPVPDTAMVGGLLIMPPEKVILPEAAPAAVGANLTYTKVELEIVPPV